MTYKLAQGVNTLNVFRLENVLRKRFNCPIDDLGKEIDRFFTAVEDVGYSQNGDFFYSLNNTPMDKMVDIEFFLPVIEEEALSDQFVFSSYFEIHNCLQTQINHSYEELTEGAYALLVATLLENEQEIRTPFYHLFSSIQPQTVTIFVGYAY